MPLLFLSTAMLTVGRGSTLLKFFRFLITLQVVFTAIFVLASCGSSTTSPILTIYAALTDDNGIMLKEDFERYAHLHVNIHVASTGVLATLIKKEKASGAVQADVLLLADPTVIPELARQGLVSTYRPTNAPQLSTSFQSAYWSEAFDFNNVIIYHKGMSLPVPHSWQELASSMYQHQIELGDPAYSGTTLGMVGSLSETYGWSYFSSLKKNHATVVQSTNTVGADVAAGRVNVGITLDSVARDLMKKGAPIDIAWPSEGAILIPASVSIVAGHENARSQEFVDWLISSQGQTALMHLGYAPALGTLSHGKLANVGWEQMTQNRISLIQQFHSVFSTT